MAASPPLVGGPAPLFQLKSVDGKVVKLSDLKGQFVVLNFWATWCVPCIKEMPELQKTHQSLNQTVKIIGINLAEPREKVDQYTKDHHLSFPVLLDDYGNVSQEYEVIHLPVTYFITPDGIIRDKIFGGGITREMIEAKINRLM
jgi:peroxiredoxin